MNISASCEVAEFGCKLSSHAAKMDGEVSIFDSSNYASATYCTALHVSLHFT